MVFSAVSDNINALLYSLKQCKSDTERVITINSLSIEYYRQFDYVKAKQYNSEALVLSRKIKYYNGEYRAIITKGSLFMNESLNDSARFYFNSALKMAKLQNNFQAIADCYNLLGNIEETTSNVNLALKYYLESLNYSEKCKSFGSIAIALNNLAIVYDDLGMVDSALINNFRALRIRIKMNLTEDLAASYNNIGSIYLEKSIVDSSLHYFQKALDLRRKISDISGIAQSLGNIAICYKHKNNIAKAIQYYTEALEMQKKIGDQDGTMSNYINLSILYFDNNNYSDAISFGQKALDISKKIGNYKEMSYIHSTLYSYYLKTSKYKDALVHYQRYSEIKDSLMNADQIKETTRIQMKYQFDKQNAIKQIEQQKKDVEAKEVKNRQTMAILAISIGLILVLIFTGIIYKSLQENKNKNKIITEQKKLVDEKNKEILDSITYARRIQQSLMPTEKYIERNIKKK